MAGEQYCLKWTNYQRNVTTSFKALLDNEEFIDVTISAEGLSCPAHRVVLSASSPYFRDLLGGLKAWQHPVLVLKDIPHVDIVAILDFIYNGKVDISQDKLQSFLRTAQFLQISGLVEENGNCREDQVVDKIPLGSAKRNLLSGEPVGRKAARKEVLEPSGKAEEEGVTPKAEPIEIGPTEFSCPYSVQDPDLVTRDSPDHRIQSPERNEDDPQPSGSGDIQGSVTCLVCRATLSNCNALYYHMNYVHSGAVEPLDIIRKMVTSEGMVKQEHIE